MLLKNWCEAGFAPPDFYEQTNATFEACMAGSFARQEAAFEAAFYQAHTSEMLRRQEKLQPASHYLKKDKPQSNDEVLAHFKGLQVAGYGVKITDLKNKAS